jgi:TolB protein
MLVGFVSFPVKAERWSTPTQVTFNMNIADDWGGPSISGDGSKVVFQHKVDGCYEVFVANSDGSGVTQVTSDERNYVHLSISGDGSKIAVASYASTDPNSFSNSEAFVINADGTGKISLISKPALNCKPAISADGTRVAVMANTQDGQSEVFVVNSDGTGLKQLTNNTSFEQYPSISSDGSKIAFIAYTGEGGMEIFVVNSDGTGLKQLTNSTADKRSPSISGDGSKIAFESRDNDPDAFTSDICVVNTDGTGLTYVVNNTKVNVTPSINYDGSKIAFSSYELIVSPTYTQPPTPDIFVVNSDGTGLQQLTQDEKSNSYPSICEDGSRISFIAFEQLVDGEIFVSVDLDEDSKAPVTVDNYDGQWHTADFRINLTATDDTSGVAETYYKINNGATQSVAEAGQPIISTEGANNKLEYWSEDAAGNTESHEVLTDVKLDKTAPTGSITINNDNASTYETSVTLTLTAEDNIEVAQMRFRNNETEWTVWETYASSKNWTIPAGEGAKIVYVQFKDNAGLVSPQYSDTIMFETPKENPENTIQTGLILAGIASAVTAAVALMYIKKKR